MLFRRGDPSLQGAALVALYTLGKPNKNKAKLFDYGIVPLIVTAMRTHSKEESVLEAACAAVRSTTANIHGAIKSVISKSFLYINNSSQVLVFRVLETKSWQQWRAFQRMVLYKKSPVLQFKRYLG